MSLRIVGDEVTNLINIFDQGNGHVDVWDSRGMMLGSADHVKQIKVDTGAGNDVVRYTLVHPLTNAEGIFFKLGDGDDWATLDLTKGIAGANLQIGVQGNDGSDMVSGMLGAISASRVNLLFDGGAGNDYMYLGDPKAEIAADASLWVDLEGGAGNDDLTTAYTGHLFGTLNVAVRGGDGMDDIQVNTKSDEDSNGRLYVLAAGGADRDNVSLYANDYSGDGGPTNLAAISAIVFDADGVDKTMSRTPNVALITFYVELGNGVRAGFVPSRGT